jgi:hypothetical protein
LDELSSCIIRSGASSSSNKSIEEHSPCNSITALLFTIGKFLIGLYLGRSSVTSAYGAAGSFAILLIWLYYSGQIFLFGAELRLGTVVDMVTPPKSLISKS